MREKRICNATTGLFYVRFAADVDQRREGGGEEDGRKTWKSARCAESARCPWGAMFLTMLFCKHALTTVWKFNILCLARNDKIENFICRKAKNINNIYMRVMRAMSRQQ